MSEEDSTSLVSPSILEIFNEEMVELTQEWDQLLAQWEKDLTQLAPIKEMRRVIHTLKGSARMVKFSKLADFCHKLEEVLIKIDEEQAPTLENQQLIKAYSLALPVVAAGGDPLDSKDKIKLSVATIENLSKLATTANITRAHLEQQQAVLVNYYDQLKDRILILDDQLKEMDDPIVENTLQDLLHIMNDMSSAFTIQAAHLRSQQRVTTSLEEDLTGVRLVSFDSFMPRLESLSNQLAQELGKELQLHVLEMSGEMDRSILERLMNPLEHLLRNAIDHGIELPQDRKLKGKPRIGVIELSFIRKGSWVTFKIRDDGCGLDAHKIREKAILLGYLDPTEIISDEALYSYILMPGFSTSEEITQISGRGIGMDVVNSEVKKMGGTISIDSVFGKETIFSIQLPLTSTLNQALLFQIDNYLLGILSSNISGITRVRVSDLKVMLSNHSVFVHNFIEYPIYYLGQLLQLTDFDTLFEENHPKEFSYLPVLLIKIEHHFFALVVHKIIGFREILVKTLGRQLVYIPEILGASLLGDGSLVLILDIHALAKKKIQLSRQQVESSNDFMGSDLNVLVVDNSVTIRKGLRNILEYHRYEVREGQDGVIGLDLMKQERPDVVLLDMEMPNMGGLEVLAHMQADEALSGIPVIVITSLPAETHKQKVLEAGAYAFLNKPISEAELIEILRSIKFNQIPPDTNNIIKGASDTI